MLNPKGMVLNDAEIETHITDVGTTIEVRIDHLMEAQIEKTLLEVGRWMVKNTGDYVATEMANRYAFELKKAGIANK